MLLPNFLPSFFLLPFLFFNLLWAATKGATFLHASITHHFPLVFPQGTFELYLGCSTAYMHVRSEHHHSDHTEDVYPFIQRTASPQSRAMHSGGQRLLPALCSLLLCPHSAGQSLAEHIRCGVWSPNVVWESWRCLGGITARTEAPGREPA